MSAKLVAIGDSVTEGFLNGSIFKTHLSFPALITDCLNAPNFNIPDFSGAGGLPLNLEGLLTWLDNLYADQLLQQDPATRQTAIAQFMDTVEDYWERKKSTEPSQTGPLHHNLAVRGFQIPSCDTLSDQVCQQFILPAEDNPIEQQLEFALYRTVRRTLNPSQSPEYEALTQIDVAQKIAETERIKNLIFWLRINHCLDGMVKLKAEWSTEESIDQPVHLRTATLWQPEHFKQVLHRVASKISALDADNVFVGDIPHVTIPPVSRGVTPEAARGMGQDADGYFEYYTHFWIWDSEFDPAKHPHLTRSQVKEIDAVVDEYNQIIQNEAAVQGWHLVDTANVLDRLAFRRHQGQTRYPFPSELVVALRNNSATQNRVLCDGTVLLDTQFFRMKLEEKTPDNLYRGGLFGLDGAHPTTIGYGLIDYEFLRMMQRVWCEQGKLQLVKPLDWEKIVASDSLLTKPSASLTKLRKMLTVLCGQFTATENVTEASERRSSRGLSTPDIERVKPKASIAYSSVTVGGRKFGVRGPEDQSGGSGGRSNREREEKA